MGKNSEKKGKEKRTLKSGGWGGIKKQKGNCDWNRKKSERKIIFSSPKSGRKLGGKFGNSGGNLRIGRGSLGWTISHLPQSRMLRGILGSSSSRRQGQRHSQRMETWTTPGLSLSCQSPLGFSGNLERGEGPAASAGGAPALTNTGN